MSEIGERYPTLDAWPLWVRLECERKESRGWPCYSWEVAEVAVEAPEVGEAQRLWLQLHRDERIAYRFNLDAENPRLFVVCEQISETEMLPRKLTCAQDVAADYMDASTPVLSIPMPASIRVWLERFMAHHGEVEDPKAMRRRLRTQARDRVSEEGV